MPADLRLYGGTALALYLDHRASTDFDFATPRAEVDLRLAKSIQWLTAAELRGGPGMVDAIVVSGRKIKITLMESGALIPHPAHPAIRAPNGVNVAHPKDLVRAKIEACLSRDAPRDFVDMAHCARAWLKLTVAAAKEHIAKTGRTKEAISATLSDPPRGVVETLSERDSRTLRVLANMIVKKKRRPGWER